MKILINGESVKEVVTNKIVSSRSNVVVSADSCMCIGYEVSKEDISRFDAFLGHLKRNKTMYMKLVLLLAMTINYSTVPVFALSSSGGLGDMFSMIIEKLISLAKYACMGMGIKEMVICLLNGGSMREASFSGVQYWLGYIFLEFYPTLYEFNF